ncbi:hypothetical protein BCR43DRAFT_495038 [Syncephalastrum racemosum]|uniref:Uncharacterized protein n=1 Tax=Syncephalastrum racemosum TaxID=13706 RepID=A0A1X2H910_SYNRA|nr:hypothetical protein BCR43DRAFT_495038 [Syncephalastrum racemosum]
MQLKLSQIQTGFRETDNRWQGGAPLASRTVEPILITGRALYWETSGYNRQNRSSETLHQCPHLTLRGCAGVLARGSGEYDHTEKCSGIVLVSLGRILLPVDSNTNTNLEKIALIAKMLLKPQI